jgi:hypothetical protein
MSQLEDLKKQLKGRRIEHGSWLKGPEYAGCFGTFTRPVLYRMPSFLTGKFEYEWIVCRENNRMEAIQMLMHKKKRDGKTFHGKKGSLTRIDFFKSPAAARRCFLEVCATVIKSNEQTVAEVNKLRDIIRSKPGTPEAIEAALALSDY